MSQSATTLVEEYALSLRDSRSTPDSGMNVREMWKDHYMYERLQAANRCCSALQTTSRTDGG